VPHRAAADVGLGDLVDRERGQDASGRAVPLQRVLQSHGVEHGGEHASVVGRCAIHAVRRGCEQFAVTALEIGLAFLPTTLVMGTLSLRYSEKLLMRFGPRNTLIPGLALIAAGLGGVSAGEGEPPAGVAEPAVRAVAPATAGRRAPR
jgi:hypothetical protein